MMKFFRTLGVLLAASGVLSSCLGDNDDEVTTYGDMAILQFTLGTLNRYTETTSSSTGNDTVVKTTLTGSAYKMTIDQLGRSIYNQEPLPVGTDVKHVLCTIATKNSGVVALQSMTSDSLSWFSSTDSIDFSQPRTFRVFAIDGSGHRDYTVTLNVSQTTGINFEWRQVGTTAAAATAWDDRQLLAWGDSVALVERGTVVKDGLALRVGALGQVEASSDLTTWAAVTTTGTVQPTVLLGAASHELFGLDNGGQLLRSADDGASWQVETLDSDAALLPTSNQCCVSWAYASAAHTDYVLLGGHNGADTLHTVFWRKISTYAPASNGRWVYMDIDDINRYALSRQEGLSIAVYDGTLLALADDMTIYQSRDQGITWRPSSDYALGSTLQGEHAAMTADAQGRLWVVTSSGQVWQGARR